MITVMWVLSLLAFAWGVVIFGAAKGGIHEVYATLTWLISAVLLIGALVLEALRTLQALVVRGQAGSGPAGDQS